MSNRRYWNRSVRRDVSHGVSLALLRITDLLRYGVGSNAIDWSGAHKVYTLIIIYRIVGDLDVRNKVVDLFVAQRVDK